MPEGIISLMTVEQPTKNKEQPVMDFRELNRYVRCHTGDDVIDVCNDILRDWRKLGDEALLVDLKSVYLQMHICKQLWKYQLVQYNNKVHCLTRLDFGLNCALRIIIKILRTVLGTTTNIAYATDAYIDDIVVDESKVSPQEVIDHLRKYGLKTKSSQELCDCTVLGLKLQCKGNELVFSRSNEILAIQDNLTRRHLFSVCGTLMGHYSIGGRLRLVCSYVKRHAEGRG